MHLFNSSCPLHPVLAHLRLQPCGPSTHAGQMTGHWAGRQSVTGWAQIGGLPLVLTFRTTGDVESPLCLTCTSLNVGGEQRKPTQTCKLGTGRAKDQTWVLWLRGDGVKPSAAPNMRWLLERTRRVCWNPASDISSIIKWPIKHRNIGSGLTLPLSKLNESWLQKMHKIYFAWGISCGEQGGE